MKFLKKAVIVAAFGFLISQIGGCATSNLVDKWHDSSFQEPPLVKILVIAVRKDAAKRHIWEDAFAAELAKHGVTATPSYRLFPDALPDSNQVLSTVLTHDFEGVMTILRLPTETDTQYIRGYTSLEPHTRYSYYWDRYWTYYSEMEHPGYLETQKTGIHAIDVTTTGKEGRLIWAATSRTPDPGSVTDVQRGIARLAICELEKRKIIGSEK